MNHPPPHQRFEAETVYKNDDDADYYDDDVANTVSLAACPGGTSVSVCSKFPDRNKDLPSVPISTANLKLRSVYRDTNHIHKNSSSHLHGEIGAVFDLL